MIKNCLIFPVRVYQWILSPLLPRSCRFYPSCSAYTIEAIESHGPVRGLWLSIKRLIKCGPWHSGGFDPVPDVRPRS